MSNGQDRASHEAGHAVASSLLIRCGQWWRSEKQRQRSTVLWLSKIEMMADYGFQNTVLYDW